MAHIKGDPRDPQDVQDAFQYIVGDLGLDEVEMIKKCKVEDAKPNLSNLVALCDANNMLFRSDFGEEKSQFDIYYDKPAEEASEEPEPAPEPPQGGSEESTDNSPEGSPAPEEGGEGKADDGEEDDLPF